MTLLAAVTLDGDNETLPLARAIVPGESIEHWSWFIHHLTIAIPTLLALPSSLVVISDHEKGIDHAISQYLPGAVHGHCCQHLAANVQKHYGVTCRNLFWATAKAKNQSGFIEALQKIVEVKPKCRTYLEAIPAERWAMWAFTGKRYGHLTSNMVESMNAEWLESRETPVLHMLVNIWT